MRDAIGHEYQRADVRATWNIVEEHVPLLATAVDRLIVEAKRIDNG